MISIYPLIRRFPLKIDRAPRRNSLYFFFLSQPIHKILGRFDQEMKRKLNIYFFKVEVVDDEYDHKKRNQFAHHMKEKSEAVSEFAKSKTVKEQREFLPIFTVRQKLMRIIADNQGNFYFIQSEQINQVLKFRI